MPAAGAQDEIIDFLSDRASHGQAGVTRIETHGNLIFLAGDEAWKIKRAVRFPYMDFSTLELRHQACLAELEINRRFASELYLGVVPLVRRPDGRIAFGGSGEVLEWAVHMRRFGQEDLLSAHAASGAIPEAEAKAVADCIARSHRDAERCDDIRGHDRIARVLEAVVVTLGQSAVFDPRDVETWAAAARQRLQACRSLLDVRAEAGFVRRCHGDLHAANIVVWHGQPMLYDAIEFDPKIATVDPLYDLAFLLMDLDARGAGRAANVILNRYLWRNRDLRDLDGLAALPLFMSLRAAIRAMVTAERAAQEEARARAADEAAARDLLARAQALLRPHTPRLVAIAGLSGTGKSTLAARLAAELAPAPGAVHLRTDLIRKALADVEETVRLPAASYTPQASRQVYETLLAQARRALTAGASVIVDAVAAHAAERAEIAAIAATAGVAFTGLWLTGPDAVLAGRVGARTDDASDATAEVVRAQATWDTGALEKGWSAIDAGGSIAQTYALAAHALALPARTST